MNTSTWDVLALTPPCTCSCTLHAHAHANSMHMLMHTPCSCSLHAHAHACILHAHAHAHSMHMLMHTPCTCSCTLHAHAHAHLHAHAHAHSMHMLMLMHTPCACTLHAHAHTSRVPMILVNRNKGQLYRKQQNGIGSLQFPQKWPVLATLQDSSPLRWEIPWWGGIQGRKEGLLSSLVGPLPHYKVPLGHIHVTKILPST